MKKILASLLLLTALAFFGVGQQAIAQSSVLYRINGLNASVAIKAPVRAATTTAITLSGAQTIDGVAVTDHRNDATGLPPDRVLVKNQGDNTTNGVYYVNANGAWTRPADFDGPGDVAAGTLVIVDYGTQAGLFQLTSTDPVAIGISSITFSAFTIASANSIISQICTTTSAILYYNGTTWVCLGPGSSGQVLAQGVSSPHWATVTGTGTVTNIATDDTNVCGGPITTTGTVSLCSIGANTLLANTTTGSAPPTAVSISSIIPAAPVSQPQGRLTLVSNTPVMVTDATTQGTIYYDCYRGKSVPYYTGSADASDTIASCEVSTTMQTSGTGVTNLADVFDIWWVHSGTNHVCITTNGSGGGWASDTSGSIVGRGTGYSQLDYTTRPYITNKNSLTHCYNGNTDYGSVSANQATYLGSVYTTAAGKTSMAFKPSSTIGGTGNILGLYNGYNRIRILADEKDSTTSWSYSTATWRAANGSANNSIGWVDGLQQSFIDTQYFISTHGSTCAIGIDLDSTTNTPVSPQGISSNINVGVNAVEHFNPQIGFHYVQAMEYSSGSCTFAGVPGDFSSYVVFKANLEM